MPSTNKRVIAACFLVTLLASCKSMFESEKNVGHEYFEYVMSTKIGMKYDDPPSYTGLDPDQFVSSAALLNGNLENGYRLNQGCTYYFEINPNTSKIVRWRYKGSEDACSITPPPPLPKPAKR